MKISNKISSFILFLLLVLCANTIIGLTQLSKIERELNEVVKQDIRLSSFVESVVSNLYREAILYERTIRIGEELGFEDVSATRRRYLLSHLDTMKEGFKGLQESIVEDLTVGIEIVEKGMKTQDSSEGKEGFDHVMALFLEVKQVHAEQSEIIDQFFHLINSEEYKISFEDLEKIESAQRRIKKYLKVVREEVEGFSADSLLRAEKEQGVARKLLWISFIISLFISVIISFAIIQSIINPLKILVKAANQIGGGNFVVNLDDVSHDEIGEVSRAMNSMAEKLAEVTAELERKNKSLSENLSVTNRQKLDLEKVNKELDRFVHTVSHDIKAPLTGIIGYGNYLDNKYANVFDPRGARSVQGIIRGAERLNQLINDLLELTRISRVKNPYEKVAIGALIQSVLERLEFNINKYNVEIVITPNLPEIICDRIKMGEVFLNLLSNAIKFSSKNSRFPKIEMGFIEQRNAYEFFVKDNGIGIAKEDQEQVFGMFKRLNSASEYEGTGAGLAIVKEIISDHRGRIWVESELGKGTEFHFTIPKDIQLTLMENEDASVKG